MAAGAFLFGKLPAHGDFVVRGLGAADRDAWDADGSALMAALAAAAGEALDAAHVAAPPWRFVTAGEGGWRAGALAPSVDRVGRRFLLSVGLIGLDPAVAAVAGASLAAASEALIYDALSLGLDADALLASATDRLDAALAEAQGAAAVLSARPAAPGVWWTLGAPGVAALTRPGARPPADLFARTLAALAATPPFEGAS